LTARRLDLVVKYSLFRHLSGFEDASIWGLYRWHIIKRVEHRWKAGLAMDGWKRSIDDYEHAARQLHHSMQVMGYDDAEPVHVDPDGELLSGAHRVACALALGVKEITVHPSDERVWAPPWDARWFLDKGAAPELVEQLQGDLDALKNTA
jgi:hypothetical protein